MRYVFAVLLFALIIVSAVFVVRRTEDVPRLAALREEAEPPCCQTCTPSPTQTPTPVCVVTCTPVPTPTLSPTSSPSPTAIAVPTLGAEISTSPKKGIVSGFAENAGQLQVMLERAGVSWHYNHTLGRNVEWRSGVPFVPMLRTELEMHKAQIRFIINVRGYVGGVWLIGNEPNNGLQDNLTWAEAADIYGKALYYVRNLDPTAQFIMLGLVEPNSWWERGFTAAWVDRWDEEPPVAGWHLHMYPWPKEKADGTMETVGEARDRLLQWLVWWIGDHPGDELWVTEFGELGTQNPQTIGETIIRLGSAFEDIEGVNRHAFFWLGSSKSEHDEWDYTSLFDWINGVPTATDLLHSYQQVPMPWDRRLQLGDRLRLD